MHFRKRDIVVSALVLLFGVGMAVLVYSPGHLVRAAYNLVPFEGNITDIEYNCLCSLSILITVEPTEATAQNGGQRVELLLVWGAQVLEAIAKAFGFDPDVPLIIPRIYMWCRVFDTGDQQLLGNYVTGSFPCYEFVGPPDWCRFKKNAQGAILNVGTSAF